MLLTQLIQAPVKLVLQNVLPIALLVMGSACASAESVDVFSTQGLAPVLITGNLLPERQAPCSLKTAGKFTLADVVEYALCNNPQTREAWASARYQAAQVGVGEAAYLPKLDGSGGVSLNSSNQSKGSSSDYRQVNAGLSAGYVLYDFGARDANLENNRQVLAAANANQDAVLQTVFLSAVQGYYQMFAARAAVDAAMETEKTDQESLNAAAARYNTGVGTPADKLQAQTAYSQAVLTRVRANGDLKSAQGVLANAMGLDANASIDIDTPATLNPPATFEQDVGQLINDGRSRRPDLVAAEAQIKAAEASVEAAKAAGMPVISASTALSFTNTNIADSSHNAALGLQVNIPIFTGYENTYRIRAAQEQVDVKQAQREKLSQQIALDVWKAYQSLVTETQAVRSSQDLLASATQSEKVALGRYKAGVGNIIDVLTAQSALANALQQNIQALYSWYIARAALAQSIGQLDMTAISPEHATQP